MLEIPGGAQGSGILAGAALVSAVHGLLPNHWAPFVLIGRAQGWSLARTLRVMLAAGVAHTAVSGGIAMAILLLGVALQSVLDPVSHVLPAIILMGSGLVYLLMDLAHHHHPHHHADLHQEAARGMTDRAATLTLILALALSPCEAMVPIFVSAAPFGNVWFVLLLTVMSGLGTIAVMLVLGLLAWQGARAIRFGWLAHHERLVIGGLLLLLGVATLALHLWEGH
ncbi:hypothetical protein KBD49_06095 [Myxococcota bacterium]|nr:hypothetical protein [Myxococcota bacterium]